MGDEELFSVRNYFYLGCYQQAISEADSCKLTSDAARTECKFFIYRSYIGQGQYRMVLDQVNPAAPIELQAVRLVALYSGGDRAAKDQAVAGIKDLLSNPDAAGNAHVMLIVGTIFAHEQDYKEALKYTHQSSHLETMSLVAHIYLSMSRPDLARKQVGLMSEQDDDATLTKLAGAWVALAEGGDKYQEALYEFQELGEKYSLSLEMMNGLALCNLHLGKFDEAEQHLQDALSKSANDVDTLVNMIVCMQHLRKPVDVVNRYISQLRTIAPSHPWMARYSDLESSFERCSAQMSA